MKKKAGREGGAGEGPGDRKAPAGASTAAAVRKYIDSAPAGADTAVAVGKYR